MEEQVRDFLKKHFPGMKVELESLPSGRITGQIVWKGFDGHDQFARQEMVRGPLKERFGKDVLFVGVLLTYTPREIEEMVAA
jgi:acid stress-induced BolA-like protein IbaG/YrbA